LQRAGSRDRRACGLLPSGPAAAVSWAGRSARTILLCAAVFGTAPLWAQDLPQPDAEGTLELTLEDAVRLALERNRGFLDTRELRGQEKVDLKIEMADARWRWAPVLTLTSGATRRLTSNATGSQDTNTVTGDGSAGIELEVPATGGTLDLNLKEDLSDSGGDTRTRTRTRTLEFRQPLLKGGPAIADHKIRNLRIQEQQEILTFRDAVAGLISETIVKFRALISAVRQVEIAETSLRRAQDQLATTRALIEAGRVARREAVRSETTIANRELALVTARNTLDADNLKLVDHLAFDEAVRIRPLRFLRMERREVDHASVLEDMLHLGSEFRRAQLNVETKRIDLERTRNNMLPVLNLGFGMSRTDDLRADKPANTEKSVSLQATTPLNDRKSKQGLARARLILRQAERRLKELRVSLGIRARTAVTNVKVRLRRIDLAREARELAESNLEIEKGKFNEGLASSAEVATSEDNLVQAEQAEVDAIDAYLAALREIDKISGRTLERWNVRLETMSQ